MRKAIILILVALFVCGALMLVGCKKKEAPTAATATAETGIAPPPPTAVPTAVPTAGTAKGTGEKPTAEKTPEKK